MPEGRRCWSCTRISYKAVRTFTSEKPFTLLELNLNSELTIKGGDILTKTFKIQIMTLLKLLTRLSLTKR